MMKDDGLVAEEDEMMRGGDHVGGGLGSVRVLLIDCPPFLQNDLPPHRL